MIIIRLAGDFGSIIIIFYLAKQKTSARNIWSVKLGVNPSTFHDIY